MCLASQQNIQNQLYSSSKVETPKEIVIKEDKKLLNKFKNALFRYKDQYSIGEENNVIESSKTL